MKTEILKPTMELRKNLCKNGRLEQKWVNTNTGEEQWKPIPVYPQPKH